MALPPRRTRPAIEEGLLDTKPNWTSLSIVGYV